MENTFWTALATSTLAALVIPRHPHDPAIFRLGAWSSSHRRPETRTDHAIDTPLNRTRCRTKASARNTRGRRPPRRDRGRRGGGHAGGPDRDLLQRIILALARPPGGGEEVSARRRVLPASVSLPDRRCRVRHRRTVRPEWLRENLLHGRKFGGREQESNLPGTAWRPLPVLKTGRPTGERSLPCS